MTMEELELRQIKDKETIHEPSLRFQATSSVRKD
jgi:hypothetical protein